MIVGWSGSLSVQSSGRQYRLLFVLYHKPILHEKQLRAKKLMDVAVFAREFSPQLLFIPFRLSLSI